MVLGSIWPRFGWPSGLETRGNPGFDGMSSDFRCLQQAQESMEQALRSQLEEGIQRGLQDRKAMLSAAFKATERARRWRPMGRSFGTRGSWRGSGCRRSKT